MSNAGLVREVSCTDQWQRYIHRYKNQNANKLSLLTLVDRNGGKNHNESPH